MGAPAFEAGEFRCVRLSPLSISGVWAQSDNHHLESMQYHSQIQVAPCYSIAISGVPSIRLNRLPPLRPRMTSSRVSCQAPRVVSGAYPQWRRLGTAMTREAKMKAGSRVDGESATGWNLLSFHHQDWRYLTCQYLPLKSRALNRVQTWHPTNPFDILGFQSPRIAPYTW